VTTASPPSRRFDRASKRDSSASRSRNFICVMA
jgi:hypothetical protein